MSDFSPDYYRNEVNTLLIQYENLRFGRSGSYIEEDGFEIIINYFEDRDLYEKALEATNYGVSQFPYSNRLMAAKGNILVLLQKYEEAIEVLSQIPMSEYSDTNIYLIKVEALLAIGRDEEAFIEIDEAKYLANSIDKLDLFFELADVFDFYEFFDKVFECIIYILELDPNNEEALYKICYWTDFTGRCEESINIHKKILDEHPFNRLAWFNLGAAFQGLKLHEKAIEAYQYATAIDDQFDYAFRNLGDAFLRLRKYDSAIESLKRVLELASPESVIYEALGHCYDKMQKYSTAREYYTKANQINNNKDSHIFYKIACTFMSEAEWKKAIKVLLTACKMNKLQPDYNLALGQCYIRLENFDDAITHLGSVVRTRPKNINGWIELLRCLYLAEMHKEGIEYSNFAWEQTDQKPIFLYFISLFLFADGKFKEAIVQLETAMQHNPKLIKKFVSLNPSIIQHRAVVDLIARHKRKSR